MATLTSQLVIELLDRVSAPARRAADAVSGLGHRIREMNDRRVSVRDRVDAALARNTRALSEARAGIADVIGSYAALQAAIAGPVQAAADFERVMTDVAKVVDFPTPEAFRAFQGDLIAMARDIPFAVEGLGEIAAAAGQAGIAREDILRFTEAAAKIGVAFDVSSQYAGGAMASLMTALGLSIDETILLADAMNHLSNNQASSAAEILHVVRNVGAQATMFGFTAEQTSAFASAMIAAGAQSDVAATSFMNMGKALTRGAAATGTQGKAFEQLGLDAEDVARKMQEDAVGTTVDVLRRISELPKEQRAAISSQLFGDEARALGPLMTNLDLLMKSLGLVGDQAGYAGSSMKEFDAQNQTFHANMQKFRSVLDEVNIRIGNALIPMLTDLTRRLIPVVTRVSRFAEAFPELTRAALGASAALVAYRGAVAGLTFVGLLGKNGALALMARGLRLIRGAGAAAAVGCVIAIRGVALLTLGPLIAALRRARVALIAFGIASATLGRGAALRMVAASALAAVNPLRLVRGAAGLAAGGIRLLGAALLANPIGLILTGLAVAGAFIYRNWSGLKEMWEGFKEGFVSALEPVLPTLEPVIDIVTRVAGAIAGLIPELDASSEEWRAWGESIGKIAGTIVRETAAFFAAGAELIQSLWDGARQTFTAFLDWVTGIPGRILAAIGRIDLSRLIDFGEPPRWIRWLMGDVTTPPVAVRVAPDPTQALPRDSGAPDAGAAEIERYLDGARARGGPISRGGRYLVGEDGPELITAARNGYVHPRGQGPAGARIEVSVNAPITVTGGSADPQAVAAEVMARLGDEVRAAFRGVFADTGTRFA